MSFLDTPENIKIINDTEQDLILYHQHSYQLKHWDFPSVITPRETVKVVFLYQGAGNIVRNIHDDKGEIIYRTKEGDEFEVRAFVKRKWQPFPTYYAFYEVKNLKGNLDLSKNGKHIFGDGLTLIVSMKK